MQLFVAVAGAKGYPSQIRFWSPQQSPEDDPVEASQHASLSALQAAVDTVTVVGPDAVVVVAVMFVQTFK